MISFGTASQRHHKVSRPAMLISAAAVAVLALSACGSTASTGDAPQTEKAGASQTVAGDAPATEEKKPAAVSDKQFTEAELTAILAGLKDSGGTALTLLPAADLAQGAEMQKSLLAGMKITPEECKTFASSNAQLPEGSVYAAGSWPADSASGATTVVTLLSADAKVLDEKLTTVADKRNACESFTVEIAGQSIDTTLKPLSVDTAAEAENAMLISQLLPGDVTNSTITVEARQGSLLISVVQIGGDAQGSAAPELATVVDQVLDAS